MCEEKLYLEPDLRLSSLSVALETTRHSTSQVINEHFSKNFFDFINQYRIAEAERLLREEPDLSVTDVAFQSGFNNRSSFYNCFRNQFGITPVSYRKRFMQDKQT